MANLIIKKLNFSYANKMIFKDLNFSLKEDKTLSIIGTSGCGKTTLLKILNGDLEYDGEILVDGKNIKEFNKAIIKDVAVVFNNEMFLHEVVRDELKFSLENLNVAPVEISKRIKELNDFFAINKIIDKSIDELSLNDAVLVKILSYAISCPKYLAIDDLLIDLDNRTKILLLNYLNYKNILLINITSDLEDTLYTDYTLCIYDGISAIDGKTIEVLKEEKLLKRLGFSLPFMVDLSIQLELYGLLDRLYLNKEEMVKNLWK